jgi:methylated-DNA-[protein]-cysteine S-methyltransferase
MNESCVYDLIEWSPVNLMLIACQGELLSVTFLREGEDPPRELQRDPRATAFATRQMNEYLSGERKEFTIPLTLRGSPFQLAVWSQLRNIPYGTTLSYGDIASELGRFGGGRAVGGAVRRNRLPMVIPCHRIVSQDGPGGFTGGLDIKNALFQIEGISLTDDS